MDHLKLSEEKQLKTNYFQMSQQPEISLNMRNYLMNWIVSLACKFKLSEQTVISSFDLIDIYLGHFKVQRNHLQLLGLTSLFLQSKNHEIYPPLLKDFLKACDYIYQKQDFFVMEEQLLSLLKFQLCRVTPLDFYDIFAELLEIKKEAYYLGLMMLYICFMDLELIQRNKMSLVLSIIYLVEKAFKLGIELKREMHSNSNYLVFGNSFLQQEWREDEIKYCSLRILETYNGWRKQQYQDIIQKFRGESCLNVVGYAEFNLELRN